MEGHYETSTAEADYRYLLDDDGDAIIDRCIAHGSHVEVPEEIDGHRVVALGESCFASSEHTGITLVVANAELEGVVLPDGLKRIGRAAFRGCSRLSSISLPESLVEIEDLAFSRTGVETIKLPRSCIRLSPLALRTGPESLSGAASPYYSKLDAIGVDSRNEAYCMRGTVLCRRLDAGALEAVLCPGKSSEIILGREVASIAPTAFAGTYEVGTLGVFESVGFSEGCGFGTNTVCERFEIELARAFQGSDRLVLDMPSRALQKRVLGSASAMSSFDVAAFLAAYDSAIAEEGDRLLQAQLMVSRLAHPLHLEEAAKSAFVGLLEPVLDTLCVQFGARNYWRGFEELADAGLLDCAAVAHAVDLLSSRGDTIAAGYLLDMRSKRFAEDGWDYGI